MSSVQSVTTPREPAARERKTAHEGAGFAALFAQIASRASLHAGAAGTLTLAVRRGSAERAGGMMAQESDTDTPELARQEQESREPAQSAARRGREHSAPASMAPPGRPGAAQTWSAAAAQTNREPGPAQSEPLATPTGGEPRAAEDRAPRQMVAAPGRAVAVAPVEPQALARLAPAREGAGLAISAVAGRTGVSSVAPGAQAHLLGGGAHDTGARMSAHAQRAPGPAEPHAPRDASAFRAQLAQGLGAALRRGDGQVTLRLRPEALGDLRVQLSVRGESVDARITTSTAEAHRLLEHSVESLRAALESRGLHPGRIEIEHGAQGARHDPGAAEPHGDQPGPHSGAGHHGGGASRESTPESGAGGATFGGGPQDDGPGEELTLGSMDHPGVVYGVADGAARIVMVDALA